jgi:CheY-like chemotaxis protein
VSESILVADDSILVREMAENALRSRGARIDVVSDGAQALERLRDTAPDLLIADVHMPGSDGYAVCRESKAQRPSTKVLLLVGTFEPFDSGAASSARADGVLRKPFLADELLRKVESLLGPVRKAAPPEPEIVREPLPVAEPLTEEPVSGGPENASAADLGEAAGASALSDADVDRIARRVLELGGAEVLERVARELLREAAAERATGGCHDWRGDPERE